MNTDDNQITKEAYKRKRKIEALLEKAREINELVGGKTIRFVPKDIHAWREDNDL